MSKALKRQRWLLRVLCSASSRSRKRERAKGDCSHEAACHPAPRHWSRPTRSVLFFISGDCSYDRSPCVLFCKYRILGGYHVCFVPLIPAQVCLLPIYIYGPPCLPPPPCTLCIGRQQRCLNRPLLLSPGIWYEERRGPLALQHSHTEDTTVRPI